MDSYESRCGPWASPVDLVELRGIRRLYRPAGVSKIPGDPCTHQTLRRSGRITVLVWTLESLTTVDQGKSQATENHTDGWVN